MLSAIARRGSGLDASPAFTLRILVLAWSRLVLRIKLRLTTSRRFLYSCLWLSLLRTQHWSITSQSEGIISRPWNRSISWPWSLSFTPALSPWPWAQILLKYVVCWSLLFHLSWDWFVRIENLRLLFIRLELRCFWIVHRLWIRFYLLSLWSAYLRSSRFNNFLLLHLFYLSLSRIATLWWFILRQRSLNSLRTLSAHLSAHIPDGRRLGPWLCLDPI